jgi:hypothetical protein
MFQRAICTLVLIFVPIVYAGEDGLFSVDKNKGDEWALPESVLEEPFNCFKDTQKACAIANETVDRLVLSIGASLVSTSKPSIVVRKSPIHIKLVSGEALISTKKALLVETSFAQIHLNKGTVLLKKSSQDIEIVALEGSVVYQAHTKEKNLYLPTGQRVFVGGVTPRGNSDLTLPMPPPLADVVERWGRLFVGEKSELHQRLQAYRDQWQSLVFKTAQRDIAFVREKTAELREKERLEAERRRRIRQENQQLRSMFQRKLLE